METWAHGQDVADTLGVRAGTGGTAGHVAHIGISARTYSYVVDGKQPPAAPIRVELAAPGGGTWTWGPEDAPTGSRGPRWTSARRDAAPPSRRHRRGGERDRRD